MDHQNIITVNLIENGSLGNGRRDGVPMVGKESGFQAIGDTIPNNPQEGSLM
jgi:hypothetical protein